MRNEMCGRGRQGPARRLPPPLRFESAGGGLGVRTLASLLVAALAALVVGCGSSGTESPTRPPGVAYAAANSIEAGTPQTVLTKRLGQPVLTSKPTPPSPGGCLYYAMQDRPLSDVWQFCLDRHDRVNQGATLYSESQPAPAPGGSAARAVLLARGDAICTTENAQLVKPTRRLVRLIKQLAATAAPDVRRRAASLMRRFSAALKRTGAQLGAFNAPPDARSELSAYLDALKAQAGALDQAATALAAGNSRYLDLRRRVNSLGKGATMHAQHYGFSTCSALAFS
jgi:hypothetical protein